MTNHFWEQMTRYSYVPGHHMRPWVRNWASVDVALLFRAFSQNLPRVPVLEPRPRNLIVFLIYGQTEINEGSLQFVAKAESRGTEPYAYNAHMTFPMDGWLPTRHFEQRLILPDDKGKQPLRRIRKGYKIVFEVLSITKKSII